MSNWIAFLCSLVFLSCKLTIGCLTTLLPVAPLLDPIFSSKHSKWSYSSVHLPIKLRPSNIGEHDFYMKFIMVFMEWATSTMCSIIHDYGFRNVAMMFSTQAIASMMPLWRLGVLLLSIWCSWWPLSRTFFVQVPLWEGLTSHFPNKKITKDPILESVS